eukprot:TRINITY_DN1548_c0_g2_i1.p1 TRINITY_DN1548_c0_g2~~TRINITY_DN1548_c0_g2_i1.p1  ORF type:complete len:334 (+),score=35.10 TRINITY_DN1548_c0_g2_i1:41-1042(+)
MCIRDREYIEFHHEKVMNPNLDPHDPKRTRYLIYRCIPGDTCEGLGDRLRGIALLFNIAMLTQRVFAIDFAHPFPLSETLGTGMIDWQTPLSQAKNLSSSLFFRGYSGLNILRRIESQDVAIVSTNAYTVDPMYETALYNLFKLNETQYINKLKHLIGHGGISTRILFTATQNILQDLNFFATEIGLNMSGPFVAIHFRAGGKQKFFEDPIRRNMSKVETFAERALAMAQKYQQERNVTMAIFLATDSMEAKAKFRNYIPDLKMISGHALHIDRPEAFLNDPKLLREAYSRVWVDWIFLARSTCLIRSPSGFSITAKAVSTTMSTLQRCSVSL